MTNCIGSGQISKKLINSQTGRENSELRLINFKHTRIPGVRKFIKYGIEGDIRRSRFWLVVCVIFLGITAYNANYYIDLFWTQRVTVIRSYDYPRYLKFPKIIMCLPTSYSFSRLLNNRRLLSNALHNISNASANSLYLDLLNSNGNNISAPSLQKLLMLNLSRTIVSFTFQTEQFDPSHIQLDNSTSHACFSLVMFEQFKTNSIGRDGGLDILLNLNAFDGMEERPGLPGGLKIIFMHSADMDLPHGHDVVYTETGHLNSLSLISYKRNSISNCTMGTGRLTNGDIPMNAKQVRFHNRSVMWPCLIHNYYTTKTSAKLRSIVVYRKMTDGQLAQLQRDASTANQLKSIYVEEYRIRDMKLARRLLMLTRNVRNSFRAWYKPPCSNTKHRIKTTTSSTYIRGKSEELKSFSEAYLGFIQSSIKLFRSLLMRRAGELLGHISDAVSANVLKDSLVFEIMTEAAMQFEWFINFVIEQEKDADRILGILGDGEELRRYVYPKTKYGTLKYFDMHGKLFEAILTSKDCWLADKKMPIEVPFEHTAPLRCRNYKNRSIVYKQCPDELVCPDFSHSYLDKYDMRHALMEDTSAPEIQSLDSSYFFYCFMGVLLKDAIRGHGLDIHETKLPAFELFRLNRIATAKWNDDRILDAHDLECRSYQGCYRLVAHLANRNLNAARATINLDDFSAQLMVQFGIRAQAKILLCDTYLKVSTEVLADYLKMYEINVIVPYESTYQKLISFRGTLSVIKTFRQPQFTVDNPSHSLIKQFEGHLTEYIRTSNLSSLAHFMNRRGKIMVGEMRIYAARLVSFMTTNKRQFKTVYRISSLLTYDLIHETDPFLLSLKRNATATTVSANFTHAKNIITHAKHCSDAIIKLVESQGSNTLWHLNKWLTNTQPLQTRSKQYEKYETLDSDFVRRNFVQVEIYFEDMAEGIETEVYPIGKSALISSLGAVGRFYMGLKVFSVAEFLGPFFVFIIYHLVERIVVSCID